MLGRSRGLLKGVVYLHSTTRDVEDRGLLWGLGNDNAGTKASFGSSASGCGFLGLRKGI